PSLRKNAGSSGRRARMEVCNLTRRRGRPSEASVSSTSFSVDLNDIRFVLFDQHQIHEKVGSFARYRELDRDIYEATLDEAARVATTVLGPINRPGDRRGCTLDGDGNVTTP